MANEYFATETGKELVSALVDRVEWFDDFIRVTGMLDKWRKSHRAMLGLTKSGFDSTELGKAGSAGEATVFKVNHYGAFIRHYHSILSSQKAELEPEPVNSDTESLRQVKLAGAAYDYFTGEAELERHMADVLQFAIGLGCGWLLTDYDRTAGEPVIPDMSMHGALGTGKLRIKAYSPLDGIIDVARQDAEHDWVITRTFLNRHDVAADYLSAPLELAEGETEEDAMARRQSVAEEIAGLSTEEDVWRNRLNSFQWEAASRNHSDDIPVFDFWHNRTSALKPGKHCRFVAGISEPLLEEPLRESLDAIPVDRLAPDDVTGSAWGFTQMFDLLGPQEALDLVNSIELSNYRAFGRQIVLMPVGQKISSTQMVNGLTVIPYNPALPKPEGLNVLSAPPTLPEFAARVVGHMQDISGINSVVMGKPDANIKSGSAMALVQSQALQFLNRFQQELKQFEERVSTRICRILQKEVNAPVQVALAGSGAATTMVPFVGSDIANIRRFRAVEVNPLSKTPGGRQQIAETYAQFNIKLNTEQLAEVLETGRLEPLLEGKQAMLRNVRRENELILQGQEPVGLITDRHGTLHIPDHLATLDSPEARQNPQIAKAGLDHIEWHLEQLRTVDPGLLMLIGEHPIPPPMPMGPPGMPPPGVGGPPPPGGHPPPPSQHGAPPHGQPSGPPPAHHAQTGHDGPEAAPAPNGTPADMPHMPQNPGTGERWNPQNGGGMV